VKWIHPVSIAIVAELEKGEKTAFELSKVLSLPYNLVYRHAKMLEGAGLIKSSRRGGKTFYSLTEDIGTRGLLALSRILRFRDALKTAPPKVQTAATEVVEAIEKKFPDLLVDLYFYGSFARGTSRRGSDVDVLIVAPEEFVEEVEAEVADVLTAHTFVMSREMFRKKVSEGGSHIRSILSGIHLRLPL
jgi:DNA-binding transcriptional ArsR family regulator